MVQSAGSYYDGEGSGGVYTVTGVAGKEDTTPQSSGHGDTAQRPCASWNPVPCCANTYTPRCIWWLWVADVSAPRRQDALLSCSSEVAWGTSNTPAGRQIQTAKIYGHSAGGPPSHNVLALLLLHSVSAKAQLLGRRMWEKENTQHRREICLRWCMKLLGNDTCAESTSTPNCIQVRLCVYSSETVCALGTRNYTADLALIETRQAWPETKHFRERRCVKRNKWQ